MTLLFVNTRSQAELIFQELWRINEDNLPIALHHGSLDAGQRRKVEAAMATQSCAPSSHLDARPRHRLGRRRPRHPCRRAEGREPAGAAHRPRQPPPRRAVEAPSWCRPTASRCWNAARRSRPTTLGAQDTPPLLDRRARRARPARARHGLRARRSTPTSSTTRCAAPRPMPRLDRATFDRVVDFVATGGYALQDLRALRQDPPGPRTASGASPIRASPSNTG